MDCTESTQPQNPASDNCNCSASWSVQPCRYSILLFCSRLCGHYIFGSADELCNFRAFLCIMFKGVMPTTEMQGSHCCYQMTKLACWPRVRLALSITCVRQRPNSVMIRSSCSMSDRRDCSPSSASATRHEHIASITSSVRKLYAGLITGQHTHIDNNSKMWHDAQNTARWTITLSHSAVSPQRCLNFDIMPWQQVGTTGRAANLQSQPGIHHSVTLGKSFTPLCLCHQAL